MRAIDSGLSTDKTLPSRKFACRLRLPSAVRLRSGQNLGTDDAIRGGDLSPASRPQRKRVSQRNELNDCCACAIWTNRAGAQIARRQEAEQQVKRTITDVPTDVSGEMVSTYALVTGFVMTATGRIGEVGGVVEIVVCRWSTQGKLSFNFQKLRCGLCQDSRG